MLVSKLITHFLEYLELEKNCSQLTIRNYNHYLRRFLEFSGDINPKNIDLNLVRRYRLYLSRFSDPITKKPIKKITQNYFLIALRAFLKYMARVNINTLSPEKVKLGDTDPRPLKVLDETHIRSLLGAPDTLKKDGIRDRCLLEMFISTGIRVSELASLNRATINLGRREFGIIGKGGKERVVFISDTASFWLEKYLYIRKDTFKPLFIRFQGKVDVANNGEAMRLTTRSIERIVEKYVKKLGLTVKATPHTLRHSFATHLLINGADIHSVSEMLGHSNISTTQIYTHITNAHLKDELVSKQIGRLG